MNSMELCRRSFALCTMEFGTNSGRRSFDLNVPNCARKSFDRNVPNCARKLCTAELWSKTLNISVNTSVEPWSETLKLSVPLAPSSDTPEAFKECSCCWWVFLFCFYDSKLALKSWTDQKPRIRNLVVFDLIVVVLLIAGRRILRRPPQRRRSGNVGTMVLEPLLMLLLFLKLRGLWK
jgi:hypothetical protein